MEILRFELQYLKGKQRVITTMHISTPSYNEDMLPTDSRYSKPLRYQLATVATRHCYSTLLDT